MSSKVGFFSRFAKPSKAASDARDTTTSSFIASRAAISLKPELDEDPDFIRLEADNEQLRKRIKELEAESSYNKDLLQKCVVSTEPEIDCLRAEVNTLRTANDTLTDRCEELEEKSQLAQSILQQHDATTKLESEALTKERDTLLLRCQELTQQSQLNQSMLHDCTAKLASQDRELERVRLSKGLYRASSIDSAPALAEIASLKNTIRILETNLRRSEEHSSRLRAWGCASPCAAEEERQTLSRRVERLEAQNQSLQDRLAEQTSVARKAVSELAEECNTLTEQLRTAETDAQCYLKGMRVGENLFRTLKAEYDNALAQVDLERTANAHLEGQILAAQKTCGAEPAGQECSALQSQIDVLTTQLAKAVAAATQRETLLETFRQQQAVLVQSVKQDRSERGQLERRIEELHGENKKDRMRFEGKLKGRDRRIAELEREVRDVGTGVEVERRGREMVVEKEEG
jgi:hypothetical protein